VISPEQGLPDVQPLEAPPEDDEDESEESAVTAAAAAADAVVGATYTGAADVVAGTAMGDGVLELAITTGATYVDDGVGAT
jgi:hypothetical protein